MSRITITDLRNQCDHTNERLAEYGSKYRVREGVRNGYQAVDILHVNAKDGCIDRNLVGGTSRECLEAVREFQWDEARRIERESLKARATLADSLLNMLATPGPLRKRDLKTFAKELGIFPNSVDTVTDAA